MEKRRKDAFHGGRARRRHGRRWRGARRRYLGSAVGTSASTTCRRARRSCGCTIAGRGGGDAVNLTGGCGGAARGRVSELGACGEERQRGREQASAPASAEVGGRVGTGAGRLRCAATSMAHGHHAAGELCRGRDATRCVSGRASAEAGQARRWAGLGWRGTWRWHRRLAVAGQAGFGRGPETRRRPANEKSPFFHLYFQENFKCQLSNIILSKKMTSFENVPKIKVA